MRKTNQQRPIEANETRHKLWRQNYAMLMPEAPNKDQKSRLGFYIDWLSAQGREWYNPDLRLYRDYMLNERERVDSNGIVRNATLSPRTVTAHLATIRARYSEIMLNSEIHDDLIDLGDLAPILTMLTGGKQNKWPIFF